MAAAPLADTLRAFGALLAQNSGHDWNAIARPKQREPGTERAESARKDWRYWFVMAGRGFGKTRTMAEAVRARVRSGRARRIALVAPTLDDARRIMVEGESGILAVSPRAERPRWIAQKRELYWPNGAIGVVYTSEEPERLRGNNHDLAWCEEIGTWKRAEPTWNNLRLMMRLAGPLGDRPQYLIAATPRPTPLIRRLVADPNCELTNGTTYENRDNLAQDFLAAVLEDYEGTRLGEQELLGKLLTDTPGALWKMAQIEALRVQVRPETMIRVVVAIDPAVADVDERRRAEAEQRYLAETGIIVAGRARCSCRGREEQHVFVLEDLSDYFTPDEWARAAARAYKEHHADRVVAEINNGGALVESNLRTLGDPTISYRGVTASRGKQIRAEPIAALYEQGKAHHVGTLAKLEDQMTTWNPLLAKRSPDRVDAAVWGMTDLMLGPQPAAFRGIPSMAQRRI